MAKEQPNLREEGRAKLRETADASIKEGSDLTDDDIGQALDAAAATLAAAG